MRKILFETNYALRQLNDWQKKDAKTFDGIIKLLDNTRKTPFSDLGKPELFPTMLFI